MKVPVCGATRNGNDLVSCWRRPNHYGERHSGSVAGLGTSTWGYVDWPEQPTYVVFADHLTVEVDGCNCDGEFMHRAGCGLEPVLPLEELHKVLVAPGPSVELLDELRVALLSWELDGPVGSVPADQVLAIIRAALKVVQ